MQKFSFKKSSIILLCSILLMTYSCRNDDTPGTETLRKNKYVNEWIQEWMDVVYLWNTRMPVQKNKTIDPANYFESLLYKAEDRFSYIAPDFTQLYDQLSGVQMEAGYDYTLFRASATNEDVLGVINYIKPHSPASLTDLKRGDIFLTINGRQLTISNYQQLLGETSAAHILGVYRGGADLQSISLAVIKYEENPVLLDSIYEMGGKKIAYLIFNFFAPDKGDDSYAYLKELNAVFGKYKQANIDELILDLRYNGGGMVTVATALASMISNRPASDVFSIDQYNSIVDAEYKKAFGANYNKTFFTDSLRNVDGKVIEQISLNKLTGLNRFYVLASYRTASASELIINSLKPYMDVILIGETTYGKNVGMWFIYEEDVKKQKDNRWGMLPVVVKTYNSANQSDYTHGFAPDIEADEYDNGSLLPLGDTHELLLETALVHIGVQTASALRSMEKTFHSRPIMSSIDRTPIRRNMIMFQPQLQTNKNFNN